MVGRLSATAVVVAAAVGIAVQGVLASTMPVRDSSYRPITKTSESLVLWVRPYLQTGRATRTVRARSGTTEQRTNPYALVWRLPNHGRVSLDAR
jgi:hypothetical protein